MTIRQNYTQKEGVFIKIIFLDIDGVLNSNTFWEKCKETNHIDEEIDDTALFYLKQIVEKSNAKIVLSSSWKNLRETNEVKQYLYRKLKSMNLEIFDQTPNIQGHRPIEIKTWLNEHQHLNITEFVSLDDDFSEDYYQQAQIPNHTIHTTFWGPNGGLQPHHVQEAINILTKG